MTLRTRRPLQLTTGPEPGRCGDRRCCTFFWEMLGYPGINGPLLLCTTHHMPAPGWAYRLANWWPTEAPTGRNDS